jgi:hypothetical protein
MKIPQLASQKKVINKKKQDSKRQTHKDYNRWRWNLLVRRNIPWYSLISSRRSLANTFGWSLSSSLAATKSLKDRFSPTPTPL